MLQIGVTDFAKRQTSNSKYSHFEGTWAELTDLVLCYWDQGAVSPHHSGVMLVPMPQTQVIRFYTGIVEVKADTVLVAQFAPRAEGEEPFIQVSAKGAGKQQAQSVEIILYSHETLAQDGDAPPMREADYYVVSVNAYATLQKEPMSPMTMARNFLGLKGGTRPERPYTAEEFVEAIVYWGRYTRLEL